MVKSELINKLARIHLGVKRKDLEKAIHYIEMIIERDYD